MGQEFQAGMRELDVTADRFYQRKAEGFLQLTDLHGHGGLRDKEAFGCPGDRFFAGDFNEGLQLLERVVAHELKSVNTDIN